jgi:hypothetical protein
MKDIIWLSPSLAAGAIAARLVAFFERRPQMSSRRGRATYGSLPPGLKPGDCWPSRQPRDMRETP